MSGYRDAQILSYLKTIHVNQTRIIIPNQEQTMAALDDLMAAVAGIQSAVDSAITLIQSLHTGTGNITDAEVEAEVTKLQAASAALAGAQPQP